MPVECLHLKKYGLLEGSIHARCPYLPTAYLAVPTTQNYVHLSLSHFPKLACQLSMSRLERRYNTTVSHLAQLLLTAYNSRRSAEVLVTTPDYVPQNTWTTCSSLTCTRCTIKYSERAPGQRRSANFFVGASSAFKRRTPV
jgi:hypothetical protein